MIQTRVSSGHYDLAHPGEVQTQVWFYVQGHVAPPANRSFLLPEGFSLVSDGDDPFEAVDALVDHFGSAYLWKGSAYYEAVAFKTWMEAHRAEIETENAKHDLLAAEKDLEAATRRHELAKARLENMTSAGEEEAGAA